MTKVTLEEKRKAVELAISCEDPRPYLKECGSRNADLMWGKIRENLKEKDPETFAQLPVKIPRSDKGKPRNEPEQVEVPEVKVDGPIRISATEPEKVDVVPQKSKITGPIIVNGKTATAWSGDFGEYHYSRKHQYLDYNGDDGTEISMPLEAWQKWLEEIHVMGQNLGVEL